MYYWKSIVVVVLYNLSAAIEYAAAAYQNQKFAGPEFPNQYGNWTIQDYVEYGKRTPAYANDPFWHSLNDANKYRKIERDVLETTVLDQTLVPVCSPTFNPDTDYSGAFCNICDCKNNPRSWCCNPEPSLDGKCNQCSPDGACDHCCTKWTVDSSDNECEPNADCKLPLDSDGSCKKCKDGTELNTTSSHCDKPPKHSDRQSHLTHKPTPRPRPAI